MNMISKEEVLEKVIEICKEVFDINEEELGVDTTSEDIEEWDSLTHIEVISELETSFEIKFTMNEAKSVDSIGKIVDFVFKKISE